MDFLTNEPQYKTIPVNDFPCCEQRPAATAVFPRASGEAPRAAETLRHPAAERKEQHRGVKNAMQLPEHGGLALKHFASVRASERCARCREGPEPPVLCGFASPEQLRLKEVCRTDEVPSVFFLFLSSPGQL